MDTISANLAPIYSAPVAISVTSYSIAFYVYVPGAYQNWSPSTADSLVFASSRGIFTGIINFTSTDPNCKIINKRDWNGIAYGSGTISTTGGNLTSPAEVEF